ncbi:hypothetical protein [Aidingimonas lacisalsi]|uniref:hypothetical protein n=1 Tax=Aidingimonas lacisalsi TaxID=2604086 RepID=UPI0011D2B190|nr:hypothetical protein [Aidingimonas lacisalsi]
MLISDSMPLLWVAYILLSVIVLVTGYLGIRFVPQLPRLIVAGVVAGCLWMPWVFSLPLLESESATYDGVAPAIVVATVDFLQGTSMAVPLTMVGLGALLGALAGVALWWSWRRRSSEPAEQRGASPKSDGSAEHQERREPVIG